MEHAPNREMITLARESRGLTQARLAEVTGLSQGYISKVEHGLIAPSQERMHVIAKALGYPVDFFFLGDRVYGVATTCLHHRKRQSMPILKLRQIHAQINVMRMQMARLLQGVAIDAPIKFHRMDLDDYESPAEIAKLVRAAWQLPLGPVQNLVGAIESAGGLVVPSVFGTDKLDAISQWPSEQPPFFFVNTDVPGDRLRWNLGHELGHIIMHAVPSPDQEHEANLFAGEFLMPAREIRPDLQNLTLPKLADLKRYWKVSMQALVMRAFHLGVISKRQQQNWFTRFSALGYRKSEPFEIPVEKPAVIQQVMELHQREHGLSSADLSRIAVMEEPEFQASYLGAEPPRLRLVS